MSNFTTEIRFICETAAGLDTSKGYMSINDIISDSVASVFDFDFPIFDEEYRTVIESKILKHYYTREIAFETVGRWKLALDARLNEIMPYYNKLYLSELLEFNPFYDADYYVNMDKDGNVNGTVIDDGNGGYRLSKNGTVEDSGEKHITKGKNGTVEDSGGKVKTLAKTGTITDYTEIDETKTNDLTNIQVGSGSDTTSVRSRPKTDRWDYYSDTPQGSVSRLEDLTYLTNARHIVEDGNGSSETDTTDYGKVVTTTDTGTVDTDGNNTTIKTFNTTDTETVRDDDYTKTYNLVDSENGTNGNTRTYNTVDGKNETSYNRNTKDITTTEDYLQHIYGKTGKIRKTFAEMLKEYRETFLNIDMMIIDNLSDLFFGLYE